MIVKIETGEIVTIEQMYQENPETCRNIPVIPLDGYAWLDVNVMPSFDPFTQELVSNPVASYVNGEWVADYLVVDLAPEVVLSKLEDKRASLLTQVDIDTDTLYQQTLGNKGSEYEATEAQARTYQASDWQDSPGALITVWAQVKGWTNQQAAEDILQEANRWRAAQLAIRAARLQAKESLHNAHTKEDIDLAYATWQGFMGTFELLLEGVDG